VVDHPSVAGRGVDPEGACILDLEGVIIPGDNQGDGWGVIDS
jgi:hypothetical protein